MIKIAKHIFAINYFQFYCQLEVEFVHFDLSIRFFRPILPQKHVKYACIALSFSCILIFSIAKNLGRPLKTWDARSASFSGRPRFSAGVPDFFSGRPRFFEVFVCLCYRGQLCVLNTWFQGNLGLKNRLRGSK